MYAKRSNSGAQSCSVDEVHNTGDGSLLNIFVSIRKMSSQLNNTKQNKNIKNREEICKVADLLQSNWEQKPDKNVLLLQM